MNPQNIAEAESLEGLVPIHNVVSDQALQPPLADATRAVGAALLHVPPGGEALVSSEIAHELNAFHGRHLKVLGSLLDNPVLDEPQRLALVSTDGALHKRIESDIREQVANQNQGMLEMIRELWQQYPFRTFLKGLTHSSLRNAVVALRTERFIRQHFTGVTDFNQLPQDAQDLLREELARSAPSRVISDPQGLKDYRAANPQMEANLNALLGAGKVNEQDALTLTAYLRNNPGAQANLQVEHEEVVGGNVGGLEEELNGTPTQPGLRHYYDLVGRRREHYEQQLGQEETRFKNHEAVTNALTRILQPENDVILRYQELRTILSEIHRVQTTPPVDRNLLNALQKRNSDCQGFLSKAIASSNQERRYLNRYITLIPANQRSLLSRPALSTPGGTPAPLIPQNVADCPDDFSLLETNIQGVSSLISVLDRKTQGFKSTYDSHKKAWDEASKPEAQFNDLTDPSPAPPATGPGELRRAGFNTYQDLEAALRDTGKKLQDARLAQRRWTTSGKTIPAPELLRRLIRRDLEQNQRGLTAEQIERRSLLQAAAHYALAKSPAHDADLVNGLQAEVRGSFRQYLEKDKDRSFEEVWREVIKEKFPQAPDFNFDTSVKDMILAIKTKEADLHGQLTLDQFREIILLLEQGVSQGFQGGGRLALGVGLKSFLYRLRSAHLTAKATALFDKPGDAPKPEVVLAELIGDLSRRDPRDLPKLDDRRTEKIKRVVKDLRAKQARSPEIAQDPTFYDRAAALEQKVSRFGYYWGPAIEMITGGVMRTIKFLKRLKKPADPEPTSAAPVATPTIPTAETPTPSRLAA